MSVYRKHPAPFAIPIAKPVKRVRRLLCWISGHRWTVLATSNKHGYLAHLHPLAGQLADCARCGERWDDLPSGWEAAYWRGAPRIAGLPIPGPGRTVRV